jgi:hypothetical protein
MKLFIAPCLLATLLIAGCGSSGSGNSPAATSTSPTSQGDIPDTANYLTYQGQGYSLEYVEGWGIQLGPGKGVTFSDKDSSEAATFPSSTSTTPRAFADRDLAQLAKTAPQYHLITRSTVQLAPGPAAYAQYRTLSPPDPVTGKQVPVIVDRYYVPGTGKLAIITLATPVGVDNVDAFKRIAKSFRWR